MSHNFQNHELLSHKKIPLRASHKDQKYPSPFIQSKQSHTKTFLQLIKNHDASKISSNIIIKDNKPIEKSLLSIS